MEDADTAGRLDYAPVEEWYLSEDDYGDVADQALVQSRSSGWLARPALERRLDEAFAKRLTTLTADAGFGKTTLLSGWATDVECGWYTVTAHATDLSSFAGGVAAAIQSRVPQLADVPVAAGLSGGTERRRAAARGCFRGHALRRARRLPRTMTSCSCWTTSTSSPRRRLPVSSRAFAARRPPRSTSFSPRAPTPPFAVDRLRGQGQVLELSAADLAFEPAEIEALLGARARNRRRRARRCTPRADRRLAGARPARRRHTRRRVPLTARAEAFEQLRGGGDAMFAYLAREVFERESPDVRQLLRTAALLRPLHPGALRGARCAARCGRRSPGSHDADSSSSDRTTTSRSTPSFATSRSAPGPGRPKKPTPCCAAQRTGSNRKDRSRML